MIQGKFDLIVIPARTLEVYTTATLDAMLMPAAEPDRAWRETMDRLFDESRAAYRGVVHENARFVEYFRTATPEPELRTINIGSRPARRTAAGALGEQR